MTTTAVSKFLKALPISFFVFLLSISPVLAQTKKWNTINSSCAIGDVATIIGLECIVANLLLIGVALAGVILFIMFIVGGFKYLTSSGDPKQVEAAKGTLTHAIIGLVVIIFGYLFIQLINNVTGINVNEFKFYKP